MSWLDRLLSKGRREAGGMHFFSPVLGDVRYGWRTLRKSPGFAALAILTLALGIGANTAIFSAVNGILIVRLPYPEASQLVEISAYKDFPGGITARFTLNPRIMQEVIDQTPAVARSAFFHADESIFTAGGDPRIVSAVKVSGEFFPLLGVRPLLGRPIGPGDTRPGAKAVVLLSYGAWSDLFGRDACILGRPILLDKEPYRIAGVMPPQFRFGERTGETILWIPLILAAGPAADNDSANVVARLKPEASIVQANKELETVSVRIQSLLRGAARGAHMHASKVKLQTDGNVQEALWILLAAVGCVLLIACVNVSSLLLARGWGRRREVAIRLALGATRRRVASQFLVESLLLAAAGGLLGLLFSFGSVPLLRGIAPPNTPRLDRLRIDANVLWFTLAISVAAGILFGLAPAWQVTGQYPGGAIKESIGGTLPDSSARRPRLLRSALVVFEVALAVILVAGAALMTRSLAKLAAMPLGLRTDHILAMSTQLSKSTCGLGASQQPFESCRGAIAEILRRVRAVPGVESAAFAANVPLRNFTVALSIRLEGQQREVGLASGKPTAIHTVSPGYFATLGIPFEAGRDFASSDVATAPRVAIVNHAFARQFFSGNAIGRRFSRRNDKAGSPEWLLIVGEVGDTQDLWIGSESLSGFYVPVSQAESLNGESFLARTAANPMPLAAAVERAIWSVDRYAPVTKLETMDQVASDRVAQPRFQTVLLGSFGALGLLLALVGVYGVMAFGVSQRTHEIGVRMALGARPQDVLRAVIREGMLLAGVGLACGIGGALGLTRFLRGLLFEVTPFDAASFASVAFLIAGVSLAACWIPARRAMRIDPVAALRQE